MDPPQNQHPPSPFPNPPGDDDDLYIPPQTSSGHLWQHPGDASSFQGLPPVPPQSFSDFGDSSSLPGPSQKLDGTDAITTSTVANFFTPSLHFGDAGQGCYGAENGNHQYLSDSYHPYPPSQASPDPLGYVTGRRSEVVASYDLNAADSYSPFSLPHPHHQQQLHHHHQHHHHHQSYMLQQQQQQHPHHHHHPHQPYPHHHQHYYRQFQQQQQQQHEHQEQQQQQQLQQQSQELTVQGGGTEYYGAYIGSTLPAFDWRYVECFGKIYPWESRSPAYGFRVYNTRTWADMYSPQLLAPRPGPHIELVNFDMWRKFHTHTCEMIITKCGRRMFPTLNVRLSGLEPKKLYNVYVDMALADTSHLKYSSGRWQPSGQADTTASVKPPAGKMPLKGIENSTALKVTSDGFLRGLGLRDCRYGRVFVHPESPNTGAFWMKGEVAFSKLKLTNNRNDRNGHVIISSMHKYQPRLHVAEVREGGLGVEEVTVSAVYPETQFIAVTAYQNTDITTLKIDNNPFAKGFREPNGQRQHDNGLMQPPGPLNVVVSPPPATGDNHGMGSTPLVHYHHSSSVSAHHHHPHTPAAQPATLMPFSSSAHTGGWEGNNGNAGVLYAEESTAPLGTGYHGYV